MTRSSKFLGASEYPWCVDSYSRYPFLQVFCDLLAVEPAVLDEDLSGADAGHDDSGYVDPGHVAFESLRIAYRAHLRTSQLDAQRLQKSVVGMVTGHGKYKVVFQFFLALRRAQAHRLGKNFFHHGREVRADLAVEDSVLDVGLDPVLHVLVDPRAAV